MEIVGYRVVPGTFPEMTFSWTYNWLVNNILSTIELKYNTYFFFIRNPLDIEDFDDDDTEEIFDEKDKDVKLPNKFNLQTGLV